MSSQFFSFCRFHVFRLMRAQPGVFGALIFSILFVLIAMFAYIQQWHQMRENTIQLDTWRVQNKSRHMSHSVEDPIHLSPVVFPRFNNAELVKSMHHIALDAHLSLDEVAYSLDDSPKYPFLRYRVTLTVNATYPLIRQFVDQITETLPHVALDTVSCARADIAVAPLNCELIFSAIFRKEFHE